MCVVAKFFFFFGLGFLAGCRKRVEYGVSKEHDEGRKGIRRWQMYAICVSSCACCFCFSLQKRKDERKKMLKALADLEDKDKKAEKNEKDAESDSANDDGLLDRFYGAEEPSAVS